ncbi:hypothetical protein W02_17750 [Nitrospira sp. KM1]|nr:hypothetical protein W02_17750 [Nitrospira sp. KM1]
MTMLDGVDAQAESANPKMEAVCRIDRCIDHPWGAQGLVEKGREGKAPGTVASDVSLMNLNILLTGRAKCFVLQDSLI